MCLAWIDTNEKQGLRIYGQSTNQTISIILLFNLLTELKPVIDLTGLPVFFVSVNVCIALSFRPHPQKDR
jgi:hypothetical protein